MDNSRDVLITAKKENIFIRLFEGKSKLATAVSLLLAIFNVISFILGVICILASVAIFIAFFVFIVQGSSTIPVYGLIILFFASVLALAVGVGFILAWFASMAFYCGEAANNETVNYLNALSDVEETMQEVTTMKHTIPSLTIIGKSYHYIRRYRHVTAVVYDDFPVAKVEDKTSIDWQNILKPSSPLKFMVCLHVKKTFQFADSKSKQIYKSIKKDMHETNFDRDVYFVLEDDFRVFPEDDLFFFRYPPQELVESLVKNNEKLPSTMQQKSMHQTFGMLNSQNVEMKASIYDYYDRKAPFFFGKFAYSLFTALLSSALYRVVLNFFVDFKEVEVVKHLSAISEDVDENEADEIQVFNLSSSMKNLQRAMGFKTPRTSVKNGEVIPVTLANPQVPEILVTTEPKIPSPNSSSHNLNANATVTGASGQQNDKTNRYSMESSHSLEGVVTTTEKAQKLAKLKAKNKAAKTFGETVLNAGNMTHDDVSPTTGYHSADENV